MYEANAGITTLLSGTVGAATAAALAGIPAIAFSGSTGSQVSYTSSLAANAYAAVYADLSAYLSDSLLEGASAFPSEPVLPEDVWLNVNFSPSTSESCSSPEDFEFILTRIYPAVPLITPPDVVTCDNGGRLPTESSVLDASGCFATVSVGNAKYKNDEDATNQQYVLDRLQSILSCF
jgi:hypothetical protein